MKSYTSKEQAKKLAEFLPLESADMYYPCEGVSPKFGVALSISNNIPCWSLAALLELIPNYQLQTQDNGIGILFGYKKGFEEVTAKCPLDACYEMILKLKEKNLL